MPQQHAEYSEASARLFPGVCVSGWVSGPDNKLAEVPEQPGAIDSTEVDTCHPSPVFC